jgi:hypothetical protein
MYFMGLGGMLPPHGMKKRSAARRVKKEGGRNVLPLVFGMVYLKSVVGSMPEASR